MNELSPATEWKGKESTGKDWQKPLPLMGEVRRPQCAPEEFVSRLDDVGALRLAAQSSGMDDFEIADELAISHGYMSKVLHGTAGLYGKRLVRFMRITGSLAPLQWLADQMGCEVVVKDSRAAQIKALEEQLAQLRKAA